MFNRRRPGQGEAERPPPTLEGGTVTAIKAQRRDPERVNIFIDGRFMFGFAIDQAVDEGIRVGAVLTHEQVRDLVIKDEAGRATTAALDLLAGRPRSSQEIRTRLSQRGFAEPAVTAAMERLAEWRYIDDADFARFWVENREANRPRGKRLLEQELRHKGVDRDTARAAIDAAEPDELAAALALAENKLRAYAGLEQAVAKRRLAGFLGRRGYGFDVIGPVLKRVFVAEDPDNAPDDGLEA